MHRNQLEHASYKTVAKGTKSLIEQIDKQIEKVEAEQNQLIDDDEQLSNLNDILQSIPGFGHAFVPWFVRHVQSPTRQTEARSERRKGRYMSDWCSDL